MCFGNFAKKFGCEGCKVFKSCKRETLARLNSSRVKVHIYKLNNTLSKFSDAKKRDVLFVFLRDNFSGGVSTYRLTKEFKRHFNIGVSDTSIKFLCEDLRRGGLVDFVNKKGAKYWFVVKKAV